MKRDYKSLDERIKKLGITKRKVAESVPVPYTTLSKIIKGERLQSDYVEKIHAYLDTVKTDGKP
jgi:predicted transcriptional regulator